MGRLPAAADPPAESIVLAIDVVVPDNWDSRDRAVIRLSSADPESPGAADFGGRISSKGDSTVIALGSPPDSELLRALLLLARNGLVARPAGHSGSDSFADRGVDADDPADLPDPTKPGDPTDPADFAVYLDAEESSPLTSRQQAVLSLVAEGLANKEIAFALDVSVETVKHHLSAIYARLGVQSRTEAVTAAARMGLLAL